MDDSPVNSNTVLGSKRGDDVRNVVERDQSVVRILRAGGEGSKVATNTTLSWNDDRNTLVPSTEGFLSLELSLFLAEYANEVLDLTQHNVDVVEAGVDSLLHFFLCSRDINLVISPKPNELTSVCPTQDNIFESEESQDNGVRRHLASFLQGIADQWRRMLVYESETNNPLVVYSDDPISMVLWNVPKIEHEILTLEERRIQGEVHEKNTTHEFFTRWKFTYPVYHWGPLFEHEDDHGGEERVQSLLDDSIESGAFGAVLPWEDAQVSTVGEELRTFTNITFSEDDASMNASFHDNEIPQATVEFLRALGSALLIFNTIFVVVMTILAKRHRVNKEKNAERSKTNSVNASDSGVLGTEEGVSEMLMESKNFAIEKSQALRSSSALRRKSSDPPPPVNLASSPKANRTEEHLVNEAAGHKREYSSRLLTTLSMENEDQEDDVDLKPSALGRKQRSSRRRNSRQE
jgi:hypothetical protein